MCNCTCIGAGLSVAPASAQVRPENTKNIVTIKHEPQIGETPQRALDAWLTPNPHFYVRNHFSIPDIRCSTWSLSIDGLITRERRFTLQQLKRFPRVTLPVTMECAGNNRSDLDPPTPGNQFQNGAVSTAYWAGARLSEVLKSAGVRPNAREVLFEGHDIGNPEPGVSEMPYTRSLPIDVALHPDTLLAYEMNGQELPKEHGHPLRLIVPGWYGMASVKWLRRISVLQEPFEGFFQTDRYIVENDDGETVPVAQMHVKSLISWPESNVRLSMQSHMINGMAWSGFAHIAKVEVSDDGGETWREADLVGPRYRYSWQQWQFAWTPESAGHYTLVARATDEDGNTQPMETRWNSLGYIINGVRPVCVEVR